MPVLLGTFLFVACQQEGAKTTEPKKIIQTTPAAEEESAPVDLQDVIETTTDYIVGISYPKTLGNYPVLARAVYDYAQSARQD